MPNCNALDPMETISPYDGGLTRQAALVRLPQGSGCVYMDQTEVTVAEYRAFADSNARFQSWDPRCVSWKQTLSNPSRTPDDACTIPRDQADPFADQKPIRCVDWCDAQAYCQSAPRGRLCYQLANGGSAQPENMPDEWPSACTNAGTTAWPWGNAPDLTACNVDQPDQGCAAAGFSCGPVAVATFPGCVGPSKIYDLIGNVREWIGVCEAVGASAPDGACDTGGGGYGDPIESCTNPNGAVAKSNRRPDVGVRCCYDLSETQRQVAGLP